MARIVVLDGYSTNPGDLSWAPLSRFGTYEANDRIPASQVIERAAEAEIIVSNKVILNDEILRQLPKLRCITVLATGYNAIDVEAARKHGIAVCNVKGYSSDSVAQHVFALLLDLACRITQHHNDVQKGGWAKAPDATYTVSPLLELTGKTLGIYGFGNIGRKVAEIAMAFGMKVVAHHKHPERDATEGVEFLSFEEMLQRSDVVSLHAPLSAGNSGIMNRKHLSMMKKSAFLINTGRGGLIVEDDLKWALEEDVIAGAGLDVLAIEPPTDGNVLIGTKNCIITPHIAWATKEARSRLLDETVKNIEAFLGGTPRNVVN